MKNKTSIIFSLLMLIFSGVKAENNTREIGFEEFMRLVLENNFDLIMENFEVTAAEAGVRAARVFEDPELEVIFPNFVREEYDEMPRNLAFEMEIPIELGGKRRNRIRLARAESMLAQANLEDFLRFLRADAAMAFAEAVQLQLVMERMDQTLEQLNQLIETNESLFEVGEIGEIDLIQVKLETRNFESERIDVKKEFSSLAEDIHFMIGQIPEDSLVFVSEMDMPFPVFNLQAMIDQAKLERTDVRIAERFKEVTAMELRLARSERWPDISILAGYHNEDALRPMPGYPAAYAGVVLPLKFSAFNPGEVRMQRAFYQQSEVFFDAVQLQVEVEVRKAFRNLQLSEEKKNIFTEGILADAERVRDAVAFSYQQGEVSLLELLEAQRTMNETWINYYDALLEHIESLVELSISTGEWYLEF